MSELLPQLAPVLVTLLTSGAMWLIRLVAPRVAALDNRLQQALLAVLGVLIAWVGQLVGYQVTGDISSWSDTTVQGLMAAGVAHVIYRLGKNKATQPERLNRKRAYARRSAADPHRLVRTRRRT